MFGPAGFLYVYFVYGMHFCANVVCATDGVASAVLLRAGEVIDGIDTARSRRPNSRSDAELAKGPARLTAVLGIDRSDNGVDLTDPASPIGLFTGDEVPDDQIRTGPRVGVATAMDVPWRFWVNGSQGGQRLPSRRQTPNPSSTAITGSALAHACGTMQGVSDHILDELTWRGLIAQSTDPDALRKALDAGPITLYCGFDPTAPSLHLGNLVQILTVRRFQKAGNTPLGLVGGATGLIGDPKPTAERTLNDLDVVAGWVQRIREQIEPYLDFDRPARRRAWSTTSTGPSPLSAIDFLRDIGKHFRVNRLLAKEAISARLNSDAGISFTEFSYQLLQANDFLELHRRYDCVLQTGGSDQWGNITSGVDLIHRATGHSVARPGHATDHQGGRHQVRQDRVRHRLARPGSDQPVRVLPVLDQRRRPGRGRLPQGVHRAAPRADRGPGRTDSGTRRPPAPPSACSPSR